MTQPDTTAEGPFEAPDTAERAVFRASVADLGDAMTAARRVAVGYSCLAGLLVSWMVGYFLGAGGTRGLPVASIVAASLAVLLVPRWYKYFAISAQLTEQLELGSLSIVMEPISAPRPSEIAPGFVIESTQP